MGYIDFYTNAVGTLDAVNNSIETLYSAGSVNIDAGGNVRLTDSTVIVVDGDLSIATGIDLLLDSSVVTSGNNVTLVDAVKLNVSGDLRALDTQMTSYGDFKATVGGSTELVNNGPLAPSTLTIVGDPVSGLRVLTLPVRLKSSVQMLVSLIVS